MESLRRVAQKRLVAATGFVDVGLARYFPGAAHGGHRHARVDDVHAVLCGDEGQIELTDIAYFREGDEANEGYALGLPFEKQAEVTRLILDNLGLFVKHGSWSYEQEARMVATVDKRLLDNRASSYSCMRLSLVIPCDYPSRRIYNSPVSDSALYCASNLVGTVEWDLCNGCRYRGK